MVEVRGELFEVGCLDDLEDDHGIRVRLAAGEVVTVLLPIEAVKVLGALLFREVVITIGEAQQ